MKNKNGLRQKFAMLGIHKGIHELAQHNTNAVCEYRIPYRTYSKRIAKKEPTIFSFLLNENYPATDVASTERHQQHMILAKANYSNEI